MTPILRGLLILAAALATTADASRPWTLEDVSVLFPVPARLPNPDAIRPRSQTIHGPYIPENFLAKIPQLEVFISREELPDQLELVGVRFDPPEVRLVWQAYRDVPLSNTVSRTEAVDIAVHTFYQIPETELASFTADWKRTADLHESSVASPLTTHSALATQGLRGRFGRAFKKLLDQHLGEERLTRVTFMSVLSRGLQWRFGGWDRILGEPVAMTIPRIKMVPSGVQVFVNSFVPQTDFFGGIGPAPTGQDEINLLLRNSRAEEVNTDFALTAAFTSVTRLENPRIMNTTNTDCVSCHIAQPAKRWLQTKLPSLPSSSQDLFTSALFELKNTSPLSNRTDNVRAFGYFGPEVAISDRSIYESAVVAERLNQGSSPVSTSSPGHALSPVH